MTTERNFILYLKERERERLVEIYLYIFITSKFIYLLHICTLHKATRQNNGTTNYTVK